MPDAVAAGYQRVLRVQLRYEMVADRGCFFCAEATHQYIGLRVNIGFLVGNFTFVDERLHV